MFNRLKKVTLLLVIPMLLGACSGSSTPKDLNGTSWALTQIKDVPVLSDTTPSLSFANGEATGSGSCNQFGGTYESSEDTLTFGPLMSTLMACMAEGVMEQESAYMAALQASAKYKIMDGNLRILDAQDNVLLTFEPLTPAE